MSGSPELVELERRVDLALKGMNLLLFSKGESVTRKEKRELQNRLKDYLSGKRSEFVELKDLQGSHTQKGR
ncbi:MAG TPA: hypothetical protein VND40_00070 [Nitrososphaerales archaeon]|nr:hypothetical protein [Nitrososphaerales archaeon]